MIETRNCPRGDPDYAEFARRHAAATLYHRPEWLAAVEDAFGMTCYRLLATRDGETVGMLPLGHVKSRLFGNFLISAPFANFGGIAASTPDAYQPLLDEARRRAGSLGCRWIELRHVDPIPLDLETHTRKVIQVLPLKNDATAMWEALPSKIRNHVRKAEKSDIKCVWRGREGLPAFYDMFARRMRDLGTPVYTRRFFERLGEQLGEAWRYVTVHKDGALIGAMALHTFRDVVECPYSATIGQYNRFGAGNLMYWTAIKDACERRMAWFDFGTSQRGTGVYKFKEQWGAQERVLHRQFWLAPGQEMPHLNPDNPSYAAKIRTWQKLPVWLTKLIGPPLARKLP